MSDTPTDTDKRHVEVRGREFPTFTVTSVEAPAMEFNRFQHDDGRYHTSVSFHDVTGLQTVETTITTDEGTYPTTTLSFQVKGENVNITLFGVKNEVKGEVKGEVETPVPHHLAPSHDQRFGYDA